MTRQTFGRLCAFVLACCLLNGCQSGFHLLIFNNTSDTIVLRRRMLDKVPLVVVAGISGELTGLSTDDFSLERRGKLLRYHFPVAYLAPSQAAPSGYERTVPRVGRCFYFQLAPDSRIYILRRKEVLSTGSPAAQPPGFPLAPY